MSKSYVDLIQKARSEVSEIDSATLAKTLNSPSFRIVDIREQEERSDGIIPGSIHLPRGFLELQAEETLLDKNCSLIVYCAGGVRSLLASKTLIEMGYKNVRSLKGGYNEWQTNGFPTQTPIHLTESDKKRYSRHLKIPEIGVNGQAKLLNSRVLLIGAGGLGSPAALYLAAAGVGTIGIVDDDVVNESNLQRQVLYSTSEIGLPKVTSAQERLSKLNPNIKIVPIQTRVTQQNIGSLLTGYDIVLDGSDNFATRYLLNDACLKSNVPLIHGSVFRFEGHVTMFNAREGGSCYRCLYPSAPPKDFAPTCAEAGVLGVLPGMIGLLQAVEALKFLLGIGTSLSGRLLLYNALDSSFKELRLSRGEHCRCQDISSINLSESADYEFSCLT